MEVVRGADQTILTNWISLFAVFALVFLVAGLVAASRLPKTVKTLVLLGLGFRVIGAVIRFEVLQRIYGAGDANGYFGRGWRFAEFFRRGDFSPLTEGNEWYGTEFVRSVSGGVLAIIGPSMFAEFVVFSLFAFIGLVGFAVAFHRVYPTSRISLYLLWILLFPSLWFWPSSIGKEALLIMGIGLSVMGFAGNGRRTNWPIFIFGLFIMFGVRPQVMAVFLVAVIIAQWLSFEGHWTGAKIMQGTFLLIVGVVGIAYVMRSEGLDTFDAEGIQEYVEGGKSRTVTGGTNVDAVSTGIKGVPMAMVNVLVRPLPWEATNSMVMLSSLEIISLWVIIYLRRKNLARSLLYWRSDRMLRFAIAFVLIYSIALGMMVVNIGIIARQRIFLFPFLFFLLEADPRVALKEAFRPREPHLGAGVLSDPHSFIIKRSP